MSTAYLDGPSGMDGGSSRKHSLRDTITLLQRPRKDSVAPILIGTDSADTSRRPSPASGGRSSNPDILNGKEPVRRLSRKLSLRPPTNVNRYDD